jgi:murein DD-endopeptidase MepM/ murein hydrolase activator NlpD
MLQVLKDMRRAGGWENGAEGDDSAGAQSLFEMLDVELASQMTRVQGFGFTKQMLDAFDRLQKNGAPAPASAAAVLEALTSGAKQPVAGGREAGDLRGRSVETTQPAVLTRSDVTSAFGWRRDPLTGEAKFHRGVDLRATYGQDVPASRRAGLSSAAPRVRTGTTVLLEHANGTRSRYAHLAVALVKAGDDIEAGQVVGRAGSSGRATGPHVHFELLDSRGTPINPLDTGEF